VVCLSVTTLITAKAAEPIEMLFGMWTQVGPKNYVWVVQIPSQEGALLRGMTSVFSCMLLSTVSKVAFFVPTSWLQLACVKI